MNTTPNTPERDLLALIWINATGTTHRRGAIPAERLARECAKQARRDWQRLFSIPKAHTWTVAIYDVTDHPAVYFAAGVFDEATNEPLERIDVLKVTA
jgi:hypothetical protein